MPSTKVSLSKVDRHKNGRRIRTDWTIRWFDEMSRRRSKTIGVVGKLSVRDAKAIQRKFQAEMDGTREQNLTADKAPTITLQEFALTLLGDAKADVPVMGWLEPKRDRKTIRLYRQAVHHVQNALGKHIRLRDITPVHVDRVWQHVLSLGLAVATARKTCVQFRAFLNFAKNKPFGFIRTNPFTDYDFGEPIAKDPRPLTDEESIALVAVAPDQWWKAYLRTLLKTGLRRTEALMLRWEDVDQANLMIHVRPRQYRKVMVNGQEYPQIAWEPKGRKGKAQKASIRSVPFPSDLIPTLEQLKKETDGSPYLFLSLSRLERLSGLLYPDGTVHDIKLVNNLNRQFDKIQKAAFALLKLEDWKPMCIHDLRETYITNAAHYVPISTLCRYAGHADPKTTIRYYTSVNTRDADAMREAMADDKPDLKLVG